MNIEKARKVIQDYYRQRLGTRVNITTEDAMMEIDNLKRRGRDVLALDNCAPLFYALLNADIMTYEDLEEKGSKGGADVHSN